jgi:glycosyltransferase involved in cell wall biosynthesis
MERAPRSFVVATPFRALCDHPARVLEAHGHLRLMLLGTRRGTAGVPLERTRLLPAIGLASYAFAKLLPTTKAETARIALHPLFDRWVLGQLRPGDHLVSSYGYTNAGFRFVQKHGGHTFLDGGNSHPENAWAILEEEHRRWGCAEPPMPRFHFRRAVEMVAHTDFVLAPSSFVAESFLARGFSERQVLRNFYPLDLSLFTPASTPRPRDRPLTIISTGSLSLRKGTPYLLEAFRLVRQQVPDARLLLSRVIMDNARPILAKYRDLPIDWAPSLPHPEMIERLRSADLFVLPSLEEGLARTVTEALACGLPAIATANTGAGDYLRTGENGTLVPIRDAQAIATAILEWHERLRARTEPPTRLLDAAEFSPETYAARLMAQLEERGIL